MESTRLIHVNLNLKQQKPIQKNEDLIYIALDKDKKIDLLYLETLHESNHGFSILIKQENTFSIYAYSEIQDKWTITPLDHRIFKNIKLPNISYVIALELNSKKGINFRTLLEVAIKFPNHPVFVKKNGFIYQYQKSDHQLLQQYKNQLPDLVYSAKNNVFLPQPLPVILNHKKVPNRIYDEIRAKTKIQVTPRKPSLSDIKSDQSTKELIEENRSDAPTQNTIEIETEKNTTQCCPFLCFKRY